MLVTWIFILESALSQQSSSYNIVKLLRTMYSIVLKCITVYMIAESQKPRQHVSNADQKLFANPETFCDMFIIGWRIPDHLGNVQGYTKYSNNMQRVRMIWKVFGQSKKRPDNLENFSGWSKKCPYNLETVSGWSGNCPDDLERFLTI